MNLVLNREKCHFMMIGRIVRDLIVYNKGIKGDKTKVKVIENYSMQRV